MISVLYRTVSMKKARPMHKTWGEPECSRYHPISAHCALWKPLTQLPVAAYFNFSRTAPKRTSPILNAGAFSADGAPSLPTKKQATFLFHRVSLFGVVCILATQHCYFSIEIFGFQAFRGILWAEFCGHRTVFVIFDKNSQITQLNFRVGYGTMTILNYGNGR